MSFRPLVTLLSIALTVIACSRKSENAGAAIARGEGIVVTREEFEARLREQSPMVRARYASLEHKKELLETLLRFELLAAEAERQKLDRDPEVRDAVRRLMVQRLVRKMSDEPESASKVSDVDAKEYYDAHRDEFQRPERLRLSGVFLEEAVGGPSRARKSAELQQLLAHVRSDEQKNPLAFSNAARDRSDDLLSKTAGGDLGYRSREELEKLHSPELARAAFALRDIGQISNVIETPRGLWVVKLAARQPAMSTGFDAVKPQLAARIAREKRTKSFDDLVNSLRKKAKVEIDEAALDRISVGPFPAGTRASANEGR